IKVESYSFCGADSVEGIPSVVQVTSACDRGARSHSGRCESKGAPSCHYQLRQYKRYNTFAGCAAALRVTSCAVPTASITLSNFRTTRNTRGSWSMIGWAHADRKST